MKYTFFLRDTKSNTETLILFSCYFGREKKKFVYSTKKSILPSHWDFKNKKPKRTGKLVSRNLAKILKRIRRFEDEFESITSQWERGGVSYDSSMLREHFDKIFERSHSSSSFFEVYEKFMEEKTKLKVWKHSTLKRYRNIKNLLEDFEKVYSYKLSFVSINKNFFREFTDYCYEYKNHYTNTFSRNIGLFKTFLLWAYENNYSYNLAFKNFKKPQRVLTREEVLSLEQIQELYQFDPRSPSLEKVRDSFVFQCLTGMRYGELKLVNKRVLTPSRCLMLKEEKNTSKLTRLIPLSDLAMEILEKYDYNLPLISNQKQNDCIKQLIEKIGWVHDVEYSRTKGVVQERFVEPFFHRISTHTARRSFITIMRNKGIADKTIMSVTGHTDIKSFHQYHQVDNTARITAINSVFNS